MGKNGPKLYKLTKNGHEIIYFSNLKKHFLAKLRKRSEQKSAPKSSHRKSMVRNLLIDTTLADTGCHRHGHKFQIVFTSLGLGTGAASWQSLQGKIHLFSNGKGKWSLWLPLNSSVGLPLRLIKVQCPQNRKGIEIFRQIKYDKVSDTKPA